MSTTLIDCSGPDAIKLEVLDDHAHLTALSASWINEEGHRMPAESTMVMLSAEAAQQIIDALTPLAKAKKPTLKAVTKETPH